MNAYKAVSCIKTWLTVEPQNGQYRAKSGIIVLERCNDYPIWEYTHYLYVSGSA
nr:MAG TPA: hypothetical protein [Caudoviricetes sp.]